MINIKKAKADITKLFADYKHQLTTTDNAVLDALSNGKLYELFVLSKVIAMLSRRGCAIKFSSNNIKFKASPGKLKSSDPHFEVKTPSGQILWLFVDIEFHTLGQSKTTVSDNSQHHELDIVLVETNSGYPTYADIWLGVECKTTAHFHKGLLKEVLGVRRELSYLDNLKQSRLSNAGLVPTVSVPAEPASEFLFAFIDPKGRNYSQSPKAFGVDFEHIAP